MIKRDLILRHMDIYMEYLYGIPSLGFLHPPTFYRQIQVQFAVRYHHTPTDLERT